MSDIYNDLILTMSNIYSNSNLNPLIKFTSSNRNTEFENILPWNISQMVTKTILITTKIVLSYAIKWSILFWAWQKVNGNWDKQMIRLFRWRESHCRTNTNIWGNKWIQKSRTVSVTIRDSSRKAYHLSKIIWNKNYNRVHRSISSTKFSLPVLMFVSKDKHISR